MSKSMSSGITLNMYLYAYLDRSAGFIGIISILQGLHTCMDNVLSFITVTLYEAKQVIMNTIH